MANRTDTFFAAEGAIPGYGFQLLVGNGASPEVFEAIAGITNITPGAMNTEDIDRTHLRSPDAHREHMAGIRDSGAFTCTGVWLPDEESQSNAGGGTGPFTSGGLVALWRGRANHNFKMVPNGTDGTIATAAFEWAFRGYVSQFQPGEIGVSTKIDFTASFQPTQAYDAALP